MASLIAYYWSATHSSNFLGLPSEYVTLSTSITTHTHSYIVDEIKSILLV